jgi:hypothetical protein
MMPLAIADRPTFDPLNAAGLLLGVLVTCIVIGAAGGWAMGSVGIGIMIGSLVGIPLAIFAVYRAYRGAV